MSWLVDFFNSFKPRSSTNSFSVGGPLVGGPIDETRKFLMDYLIGPKGKILSQLIAKSWLPGNEKLKADFLSSNQETLKQLLIDNGIFVDKPDADSFETIEVQTNFNNPPYYGKIGASMTREDQDLKFKLVIPYPDPKPIEVTDQKLDEWINNQDPNQRDPESISPYIPHSTS